MDAGDPRSAAPHARPGQRARHPHPPERPPDVPPRRGRGRRARWLRARVRLRDHRVPARELVLHAAVLRVHDLRGRELPGAGDLPRGRRGGEPARRHRVAPHRRRGPGARRSGDPRGPERDAVGVGRPAPAAGQPAPGRVRRRARRGAGASSRRRHVDGAGRPCGDDGPARPDDADVVVPLHGTEVLVLSGEALGDDDREVLKAFAGQVAIAVQQRELRADAERAEGLAEANELRTALLAAVSHDLRTPLSSIKASVTSLLQRDVDFTPGGDARAARDHRRGHRSAQPPRRQPARHEPVADRRAPARDARRRSRRGVAGRRSPG